MEHGFFHPDRGYWQTISTPSDEMLATHPEGTIEVPLRPSALYIWGGSDWIPPSQESVDARLAIEVRAQRNFILATEVDPLISNPFRWADLTTGQQEAWADYSRALLDIPQQEGFPAAVAWPTRP